MLLSQVRVGETTWAAAGPVAADGTPVDLTEVNRHVWAREMLRAAACLRALRRGPQMLMVFHPDGFGED